MGTYEFKDLNIGNIIPEEYFTNASAVEICKFGTIPYFY